MTRLLLTRFGDEGEGEGPKQFRKHLEFAGFAAFALKMAGTMLEGDNVLGDVSTMYGDDVGGNLGRLAQVVDVFQEVMNVLDEVWERESQRVRVIRWSCLLRAHFPHSTSKKHGISGVSFRALVGTHIIGTALGGGCLAGSKSEADPL